MALILNHAGSALSRAFGGLKYERDTEFQVAIADFRRFFIEQGYADELTWVFRDDLWLRGPDDVLMRYPPPLGNVPLAKREAQALRARGRHVSSRRHFCSARESSAR